MKLVGVRFKPCSRLYDFDAEGFDIKRGDEVVVETEMGLSIGRVILGPRDIDPQSLAENEQPIKKIIRIAQPEDILQREKNKELEKEAYDFCLERIRHRDLTMKLICTESTLDRKRIIFYFTADGRIDFRELVKDLAAKFKTRIEMRQIGVRDGAKALGGIAFVD